MCVCVKVLETGAHFPICPSLFTLLVAVRKVQCVCVCVIVYTVEEAFVVLATTPAPCGADSLLPATYTAHSRDP